MTSTTIEYLKDRARKGDQAAIDCLSAEGIKFELAPFGVLTIVRTTTWAPRVSTEFTDAPVPDNPHAHLGVFFGAELRKAIDAHYLGPRGIVNEWSIEEEDTVEKWEIRSKETGMLYWSTEFK